MKELVIETEGNPVTESALMCQWIYECTHDLFEESGKESHSVALTMNRYPKQFAMLVDKTNEKIVSLIKEEFKIKR